MCSSDTQINTILTICICNWYIHTYVFKYESYKEICQSQYCRLPIVCLCRLRIHNWTPTMRDTHSTTSYLVVVGNEPPPAASLHPDPLLPDDLQWVHSPGCPPPIFRGGGPLGPRGQHPILNIFVYAIKMLKGNSKQGCSFCSGTQGVACDVN